MLINVLLMHSANLAGCQQSYMISALVGIKPVYSEHLGTSQTVLTRGILISEVSFVHCIVVGPQLHNITVLIIEVSLFQSVHNSRFDCKTICTHYFISPASGFRKWDHFKLIHLIRSPRNQFLNLVLPI